ncbi:Polyisoprenoid-binding protein YceI [Pustulibacterium marinum]|uniref:Polyisoprenoid-binding protein YceI n=1 Tax=Pustulibacterium marinum TaxID=1224947 RepID=A0A1I7HQG1_9FLAO|nr:YceI family protein [Pustulibacterium marinum]SFU62901.1 Polyisoprenoid-binding protein YceI [Pustulibacterium marinum]
MKKRLATLAMALVVSVTAFAQTKTVKAEESTVTWKGYKVTGSHEGTVDLKSGTLKFDGDKLTGGQFTVDMTTIGSTDLEGEYKGKLDGHLKSEDFFGVEKYPNATLKITKVKATGKNSYKVTGDLTIKSTTEPITFDMSVYGSKATATLKIDRSKYDVRYGSGSFFDGLGDKTIYDEFDLVVDLQF